MNWKFVLAPIAMAVILSGCASDDKVVESTPQACIEAMDAAEALVTGPVAEQTEDSIVLVNLIPLAFEAGMNMDKAQAESIISTMDEVNDRTEARNSEIKSLTERYNEASEKCRASAGTNS